MAAAASAGTTLRATKSLQSLNFALPRASMMTLERAGPIWGSLSSSAAVAVLRLVLAACGAVAAPVVAGLPGAVTASFAGCAGWLPWAKAGADKSASATEVTRTRGVNIAVVLSLIPGLMRASSAASRAGVLRRPVPDPACLAGVHHRPTDGHTHSRSISNDTWMTRSSAVHLGRDGARATAAARGSPFSAK